MKKRTVWFGVPVYVVRWMVVPLVVLNSVWIVLNIIFWKFYIGNPLELLAYRPALGLGCIFLVLMVPIGSILWFVFQPNEYMERMKRLCGHVCFVCNSEIEEGLDRCSKCGAEWSLDDLNIRWWNRVMNLK